MGAPVKSCPDTKPEFFNRFIEEHRWRLADNLRNVLL